jgi:hypothetical protein
MRMRLTTTFFRRQADSTVIPPYLKKQSKIRNGYCNVANWRAKSKPLDIKLGTWTCHAITALN